mgnify:CR=1 FL=1
MASLSGQNFSNRCAFVFRFMRQHWPIDHIAYRIDPSNIGLPMPIGLDLAAFRLNASSFKPKAIRIRLTTRRNQDDIGFNRLRFSTFLRFHRFKGNLCALARLFDIRNFGAKFEFKALFFQFAEQTCAFFFVELDDVFIEGLVPKRILPRDYWEIDEFELSLTGRRTRQKFELGDRVLVQIYQIDRYQRQITFRYLEHLDR